jgi:hypothetical protein
VFVAHAKALELGNAKYPVNRVVCKSFTVPQGNMDFTQENIFNGVLPSRLVVGMVDNDALNGVYTKNPYNFKHYNLAQLKLYLDGQQQSFNPIDTDFVNNQFIKAYLSLFEGTGKFGKNEGVDIKRNEYSEGYTLFAWDLSPDLSDHDHLNLARVGSVRLDAKFRAALPNTINVIVYAEFESLIEIDRNKNVLCEYSS